MPDRRTGEQKIESSAFPSTHLRLVEETQLLLFALRCIRATDLFKCVSMKFRVVFCPQLQLQIEKMGCRLTMKSSSATVIIALLDINAILVSSFPLSYAYVERLKHEIDHKKKKSRCLLRSAGKVARKNDSFVTNYFAVLLIKVIADLTTISRSLNNPHVL